jgi:glycosyltransferase involved in cell wall biosynthesis
MKKVLVWETLSTVSGGQKMTLTIIDMLSDQYDFCCLIPAEGMLSDELRRRSIPYVIMGDQTLPTGVKDKSVIFRYGWMSVKNIYQSIRVIRSYKPDLLYCPGPAALPWSAICGGMMRKPVIWHLHHIFLDGTTKKLLNICGKFKSVKKIIAVSNCVGEQIKNKDAHQKVEVLYNPVDVIKYSSGNPDRILAEIEKNLGRKIIRGGVLVLAQIGAITKNKCQDIFVKAAFEIKRRGYEIVGLIVGDAITDTDREYKKSILDYIHKNDLDKDVLFTGFRSDVPDILSITDCVIVPSNEGLGLVAMEAMSSKTRVVGINIGGSFEVLKAAKCGELYPANGTECNVADAVLRVMMQNDQELLNGYQFCCDHSYENYSNGIHGVFGNIT